MNNEYLLKMANQIADFFASQPDQGEAVTSLAHHLKSGWEPRMRSSLLAYYDQQGAGLHPLVRQAIESHRTLLTPPSA